MQSTNSSLAAFIDHTLLKPEATESDVRKLCHEAIQFQFKGVCVNSRFVPLVHETLANSGVLCVAVVGFPLGAMAAEAKAFETQWARSHGADEIDMVIAIGELKLKRDDVVRADIEGVVRAAAGAPVKVILETALLDHDEIVRACQLSELAGATFVKTSTGFSTRGASLEDVKLMRASVSTKVQVKASGGIKTLEQAQEMIRAGATRLGTSSGVSLIKGQAASRGAY